MDRNAPEMEPDVDEGKLSTPRQRLLAAVDLDGVIETEPRSPVQEGTPAWRTPARLAEALKSDDDAVDEVAVAQALADAMEAEGLPVFKTRGVATRSHQFALEAAAFGGEKCGHTDEVAPCNEHACPTPKPTPPPSPSPGNPTASPAPARWILMETTVSFSPVAANCCRRQTGMMVFTWPA